MITIQTPKGNLELYNDTAINWSWTAFRFQDKIREPYSNDITIPKTNNNLQILEAIGLLYSPTQLCGSKLEHSILSIGSSMIPVYLQVVSITADEINICLFEDVFPYQFKDKKVHDYVGLRDTNATIFRWNIYSHIEYPDYFKYYDYGCNYSPIYAQLHPSMPINNILTTVANSENLSIEAMPQTWRLMASRKVVCPQNTIQVIEFSNEQMDDKYFKLYGGQHILNDGGWNGNTEIQFNRQCIARIKYWCWWVKKNITIANPKHIKILKNGHQIYDIYLDCSRQKSSELIYMDLPIDFYFTKDDVLTVYSEDMNNFDGVSAVIKITYDYNSYIETGDDYDTEMQYVQRRPEIFFKSNNTKVIYEMSGNPIGNIPTENLSFCYFGYYCNLPEISIGSLLHSLQWIKGAKITSHQRQITFTSADSYSVIDGRITEVSPYSSQLGQKNYIKFADNDYSSPISTIQNDWLEGEKTIHQSIFEYMPNKVVRQYSNPKPNDDGLLWDIDFNEIDTPVLFNYDINEGVQIPLYSFGFEDITQSNQVKIETISPDTEINTRDIVYLDGIKYFVIEGNKDVNTNISTLTCICVPTKNS